MKVLYCTRPGHFEYAEQKQPEAAPGHALLKIRRIGICGTDLHAFEGTQPYFEYPRILGHELSGDIMEGGEEEGFQPGERVTFLPYFSCGRCIACRRGKPNCCVSIKVSGVHIDGGMCEYLSVPVSALVKSNGLSYEQLALVEPLAIGAHAVRRSSIGAEDVVLVVGAGPIGLGVMEFVKIARARLIVMDRQSSRLDFCRNLLKPDFTIGSDTSDVAHALAEMTGGDMASVVIDATGNLNAINQGFQYISHGGRYVLVGLQKNEIQFSHPEFHKREATLMSSRNATRGDFERVIEDITTGVLDPIPFITHRTSFDFLANDFPTWLNPASGVVKAMVSLEA